MDARAWIRGERPWSQFLTYCDRLGRTQGTELWAAYLNDERLFDEYRKQLDEEDPSVEHRPALSGYDRTVEMLHAVQMQLAVLIRVTARNPAYPLPVGPLFPRERFESEREKAEVVDLFAGIAAGIKRGKSRSA